MKLTAIEHNLMVGFYRSAQNFPLRPALDVNNEVFTYAQLGRMASSLSSGIENFLNEQQKLVALFAYRSPVAYAGVLGILGVGGGYVPLHPDFPTERNAKILGLAKANVMIVSSECADAFEALLKHIDTRMVFILAGMDQSDQYGKSYPKHIFITLDHFSLLKDQELCIKPVAKDDIAYLLFTSGSTGEPKGVPVSHYNVRSYVEFITKRYDINENDRCSQMHDLTFDFSIHDIYPTFEKGACLCVATKEDKFLPVSYIQKKKITSWASVPSIAGIMDKYGRLDLGVFPGIRYSFFCGEALYVNLAQKWQAAAFNSKIINLYGPTEATMAISYYDWDKEQSLTQCVNGIVPIGEIFDGQQGRVIHDDGAEAATNEPGELCLSGSQVTKGYWHNPQQTKAQYVTFEDTGNMLWYKTGDLVQREANGCLHYLGRIDNQIKIMGNRIELGAIDQVLRESSGVDLAVAIPLLISAGNASGVVAFVCSNNLNEKVILEYCRNKLPKYMIPEKIHFINHMPFNSNGKIDRLKLSDML